VPVEQKPILLGPIRTLPAQSETPHARAIASKFQGGDSIGSKKDGWVGIAEGGKAKIESHADDNLAVLRHISLNLLHHEHSSRVGIQTRRRQRLVGTLPTSSVFSLA